MERNPTPPPNSTTLALTHAPFLHSTDNYPQSFNYNEQITAHAPPVAVGVHTVSRTMIWLKPSPVRLSVLFLEAAETQRGDQVNDLAAEQKIYSSDCWQVYCTTGVMNRLQRGTAAGLGLSQCHFDDLAWDRTRRLTA